ncbi:hypothetical protein F4821DRAFT_19099 [Hypoxylon rubiginosum]|uniref:Uncharacterized protein n=1 Tax=Hypoxylon rubiginosum TaxID=110542 RepID=A0ACC0DCJ7_9PEZI|nr:hypothetical protein F4821DRAFT_19099 [Hypoxylon rubiginosum]
MENVKGPDISISNGTCFYMAANLAWPEYIPCGNVAVGSDWPCCVAGDICTVENACRQRAGDTVYLAGCTDPAYKSPQCPDKGQHGDQIYVPLIDCDSEFSGCPSDRVTPDDDGNELFCRCDPDDVLFSTTKVGFIGQLPSTKGGIISWYPDMQPSYPVPKPTSTSTSSSTPSARTPSSTSTTTATSSSFSTLSSGSPIAPLPTTTTSASFSTLSSSSPVAPLPTTTIPPDGTPVVSDSGTPVSSDTSGPPTSTATYVGVGVGVGVGAILIGCLLYLGLLLRKRKRTRRNDDGADQMAYLGQPTIPVLPPASPGNDEYPTGTAFFKSELPADGPKGTGTNSPESSLAPQSPQQRQYQAYNPLVHGNYAERRESARSASEAAVPVSPWSPTSQEHGQQGNQGSTPAAPSNATQIHELAG